MFQCRFAVFSPCCCCCFKPQKIVTRKSDSQDCCCGWWLSVYKFWLDLLVYFIHNRWANTHKNTQYPKWMFNLHDLLQTLKLATILFFIGGNVKNSNRLHPYRNLDPNYLRLNAMTHKHIQTDKFFVAVFKSWTLLCKYCE